jgi:hypothetical protein
MVAEWVELAQAMKLHMGARQSCSLLEAQKDC